MNQRIEKVMDELIIVRLRCVYNTICGRQCGRIVEDITIKEGDLVLENSCDEIHFKKTLANALKRLKIDPEKILCDKHPMGGDNNEADKNSDCADSTIVDNNTKNFRHG